MKTREWIILIVAVVLIGLIILENFYVNDTLNFLKTETEDIKNIIFELDDVNNQNLIEKVDSLSENWEKKENIMCLLVNHKDLEKVGEQIEKLKVLLPQNKKEEAEYEANLLFYYAEGYDHLIKVSFQNIF